ncbi:MAG: rhodanese-like domain-containing protein [Actinobacteria bacterium]|nr:rhodanese-like domain-containing protein [Actinomycetota bacterium]MCB9389240.1 rhodanese-like domain-containing protein [Acidimicrobiia bacterium]
MKLFGRSSTAAKPRNHPVNDYKTAKGKNGQIIDVRTPDEVRSGMLPGAKNIPVGELGSRLGEIDKERPVLVVCRSGARSSRAAKMLSKAGYPDVINLSGGMMAYRR